MSHLVCIGLGYSAATLAGALASVGWRITGTSRSAEGAAAIAARGHVGVHWPAFDARPAETGERPSVGSAVRAVDAALHDATHLLVSAPPDASGDPVLAAFESTLAACRGLTWVGYLSTIGVYGDCRGAWVDERSPAQPGTERSRRRLAAELSSLAFGRRTGVAVQVFRLAGIYGPGRSVVDQLRAGTARRIVKPGHMFNRIHVEDIAGALKASIARPRAGAVYNVTDDEPAAASDVVAFAAELMGLAPLPAVPFAEAQLSEMGRSFYEESKLVRNDLLKRELGLELRHPTFREGIAALLRGNS